MNAGVRTKEQVGHVFNCYEHDEQMIQDNKLFLRTEVKEKHHTGLYFVSTYRTDPLYRALN